MQFALDRSVQDTRKSVALKAYAALADEWGLPIAEAAALADMSDSTWKRAKKPGFAGELTQDQMLRLSAVIGIYKALKLYFDGPLVTAWVTRPNLGPLFVGQRPVDAMIAGGLPMILTVRSYLDSLRGGA